MDHPKPWLRYIEASNVNDLTLELDGMAMRNDAGEDLGSVDGLIVDSESGRPFYIVADAGGLLKSRQYLVPIGLVHLPSTRDALHVSLTKEQIERFPGFDTDEFDRLSEDDIKRVNDQIGEVCEPGARLPANAPYSAAWSRAFYTTPGWWRSRPAGEAPGPDPHFDGRAQPGDVLGVETGGAQTHVGDSKEDEVKRRQESLASASRSDR